MTHTKRYLRVCSSRVCTYSRVCAEVGGEGGRGEGGCPILYTKSSASLKGTENTGLGWKLATEIRLVLLLSCRRSISLCGTAAFCLSHNAFTGRKRLLNKRVSVRSNTDSAFYIYAAVRTKDTCIGGSGAGKSTRNGRGTMGELSGAQKYAHRSRK